MKENKLSDMNFLEKFVSKFNSRKYVAFTLLLCLVIMVISFIIIFTQVGPYFLGSYVMIGDFVLVTYMIFLNNCVQTKLRIKEIEDMIEKAIKDKTE